MKIVTIGGGSGQHGILSGLTEFSKKYPDHLRQEDVSAIVSTFDSGGHTKKLIEARIPKDVKGNFLPPGDIRQCLAAMANNEFAKKSFQYRIQTGENRGAVVGNILLDAGYEQHGDDFEQSIELLKKILDVKGNVFPCTLTRADFHGVLENDYEVSGEENVVESAVWFNTRIRQVYVKPATIPANKKAVKAILEADKVILSQGSLFTSLIPNLLVPEIADAIKKTKAKKIYIMNIVTQRGETDGFSAKKHLEILEEYLGKDVIDHIIIHTGELPSRLEKRYEQEGQRLVADDLGDDPRAIRTGLVAYDSPFLRHDPEKLAAIILKL
jgi:uncharacterized cofD-like protein